MTKPISPPEGRLSLPLGLTLATASGLLWALSTPPLPFSGLAWVAMLPLLFVLDRTPSFRKAAFLCTWTGLVGNIVGFYWLFPTIMRFTAFPWPASSAIFFAICAYQGLLFTLFGAAVHIVRHRKNLSMAALAPLAIVSAELVLPMLFPYSLAITQAWHPLLLQVADLTGPVGVSALLLLVNGALYDSLYALFVLRRRTLRAAIAAGLILTATLIYGELRMRHFDALSVRAPKLRVGIVQPNVAYQPSANDAAHRLAILQEQSRDLEAEGAQLIVWTETSYPYLLRRDAATDPSAGVPHPVRQSFTTPIIIGAQTIDATRGMRFNSAVLIDRTGAISGIYDKIRLLNFAERIPFSKMVPWLADRIPRSLGRFTPGIEAKPFQLTLEDGARWRLGTFICFEDTLPELLRKVGNNHPDLLVNITNDSWFGDTSEPWEHLALSVFDSIEVRSVLVRSVNSGVSAFIDANGRVVQRTYANDSSFHQQQPSHSVRSVPMIEGGHTLYSYVGDLFSYICILCLTALMIWSRRTQKEIHSRDDLLIVAQVNAVD